MKVIFSRKGFDDAYGGAPNVILPDGRLLVFPIPEQLPYSGIPYGQIKYHGKPLSQYLQELKIHISPDHTGAHLDPDLIPEALGRGDNWRPCFGSHGAANTHLINEGVGEGDLFLFFATFQSTRLDENGRLCWQKEDPRHIIFSWMLVGERIDVSDKSKLLSFLQDHPHIRNDYGNSNSLYMPVLESGRWLAGSLDYRADRVLTRTGFRKSQWWLPFYFHPDFGTRISRHLNPDRYHIRPGMIMMDTVSIGQDFVVTGDERIGAWAQERIR